MTNATQTEIDALFTVIKGDILTVIAGPLETFLVTIKPAAGQAPNVNVVLGAWIQLHGALLAALPQLEGLTATQVITSLQGVLAKYVSTPASTSTTTSASSVTS